MAEHKRKLRICLVASGGGHMNQMLNLADSWSKYETYYITTTDVIREKLQEYGNVYVVGECNHEHPIKVTQVVIRCLRIYLKERPNVVISTGAAVGCITCFLGKICGAKVVWIDSITNVQRISLSGRMVRYIADLFLVQWPDLIKLYKNVEYFGAVI